MKVYIVYDRTLETTIGVYTNRREAEKEFREATTDPARTLLGDVLTDEEGNIQYHCIELKQDVIKLNKRSILRLLFVSDYGEWAGEVVKCNQEKQ